MSTWLHGTLYITVYEATNVPKDKIINLPQKGFLGKINKVAAEVQEKLHLETSADAYVTIDLGNSRRARTSIIPHCDNPAWHESFKIPVADPVDSVVFKVKDSDPVGAPFLGKTYVEAAVLAQGMELDGWYPLLDHDENPIPNSAIKLKLYFRSVVNDRLYNGGIARASMADDPDENQQVGAIPNVYFPLREGCNVTLYHDAHQEPGSCPDVMLASGQAHVSRSCWNDLYTAITNARHFIYLTGWSVNTTIRLCRDPAASTQNSPWPSLGNLLKQKAEEGVRVLMLVWDDRTSFTLLGYKRDGIMDTGDQDTYSFFHGSKVTCALCPRNGGTEDSMMMQLKTGSMFTHHQKSIMLDSYSEEGCSKLVAFLGGIDVCKGRYDTKQHSLFRTLQTVHAEDYHQPCSAGAKPQNGGPREPWHDIHCKLEGPVAYDVLHNFEQRWLKQAGEHNIHQLMSLEQAGMYVPAKVVMGPPDANHPAAFAANPEDPEAWRAQLFRSIDSDSVDAFPTQNAAAVHLGLTSGRGKCIDFSAQKAWVQAIRRAQHFIYIENQYFLGSSYLWPTDSEAKKSAVHLIPAELTLKIVSKINAGQRFVVYIVVPMYPEGVPDSASVQEILYFQANTMRAMYGMIAQALASNGITHAHPRDYLVFLTLGNREMMLPGEMPPAVPPPPDSYLARCQRSRRFMVYVHAKMMIVDDEYVIIGSANVNQRSMDGSRDTELAVGAFQPGYLAGANPGELPEGQVRGFRLAIWEEHTNIYYPCFRDPASLECVKQIREIGDANWQAWSGEHVVDMYGHLMNYPVHVTPDGRVESLPGFEKFPDTAANILGNPSGTLPDLLTS